jgi:hypothetical protein
MQEKEKKNQNNENQAKQGNKHFVAFKYVGYIKKKNVNE